MMLQVFNIKNVFANPVLWSEAICYRFLRCQEKETPRNDMGVLNSWKK